MLKKIFYTIIAILNFQAIPAFASKIKLIHPSREEQLGDTPFGLPQAGTDGLPTILKRVLTYFTSVVASIAVLAIIIASIMYISSAGDEEKAKKAKNTIVWAVVGLIIAIFSWSIVYIILRSSPLSTAV